MMKFKDKMKGISKFDIFGHAAGVTYKGEGTFNTLLGAACTITLTVFICINLAHLLIAYNSGSKTESKNQFSYVSGFESERYYLREMGIELALWQSDHPYAQYSEFQAI